VFRQQLTFSKISKLNTNNTRYHPAKHKRILNGREIEPDRKTLIMTWKFGLAALCFIAAAACNNEASVQDKTDSVTHTSDSNQSNWPQPRDVMGKDSVPSPETHSDSSHLKSH
jgi:hypothetical protein